MAEIKVTDRDGAARVVEGKAGRSLMEVLRDANLGVEGTCGGVCACGTCHVFVAESWLTRIAPQGTDEAEMLEAIGAVAEVRPNSRLACQIPVSDDISGLEIEIGPMI